MARKQTLTFVLESVTSHGTADHVEALTLHTNAGDITARLHPAPAGSPAVVWVGGAGGGLDGPAWGMYPRLAGQLAAQGIASLRLHYRHPNELEQCVADTLLGVACLRQQLGYQNIALVGHSFGGAVVISAGALSDEVTAVVAMSSQTYGTCCWCTADEILPDRCSRDIYARAREPKEIRLFAGCCHGLDECREQVDAVMVAWLVKRLAAAKMLA